MYFYIYVYCDIALEFLGDQAIHSWDSCHRPQPHWGCFKLAHYPGLRGTRYPGSSSTKILNRNAVAAIPFSSARDIRHIPFGIGKRRHVGHNDYTYATIPFRRLHSSRLFHQRPSPVAVRQGHAGCVARISGRHFQTIGLCADPNRRHGRSCSYPRAIWSHGHTGGMGEGIETRLERMAQGTRVRLRRFRMAGRLRRFLREPIQSRTGEAIHRRTGGASSQGWFSRRAADVVETIRDRMG